MSSLVFLNFIPFLGVVYVVYSLIQALRKKQQGIGAVLLALIALAVPLATLFLGGTNTQADLLSNFMVSAVIVFVGSLLVLFIERRSRVKSPNRSYGMIGVGLGVLIVLLSVAYPLLVTTPGVISAANMAEVSVGSSNTTLENVSAASQNTAETSAFVTVLTGQTGLTSDEITAQLESGNTIADLVTAHTGDLDAVISAAVDALDDLTAQGGMPAQMLSQVGGDTTTIATQLVQGELDERAQQMLVSILITGGMPTFPGNGQIPPDGSGGIPAGEMPGALGAEATQDTAADSVEAAAQSTTIPATPTTPVIRPTLITFPTGTPTPVATQPSVEVATGAVTCTITPIYNLNLRDEPNTDSTVYLSIPYGTPVISDAKTTDDWYHVSYDGQQGWVAGEYVSSDGTCDTLAVVEAN